MPPARNPPVSPSRLDLPLAERHMRVALEEAARAVGRTHPEPRVGAVVVKAGRLLGRGHLANPGSPSAETVALEQAGKRARGADLYLTGFPRLSEGRVCFDTQRVLASGVRRVVTASLLSRPAQEARVCSSLRRAGVEVFTGVLREEAERLNRPYFKVLRKGLPWVTLKAAATLDGQLATSQGDSRWVTGPASRAEVHRLRNQVDGVLVGVNTALADDPSLTTRLPERGGRDALRVVLDSRLRLSPKAAMLGQASSAQTVVATLRSPTSRQGRALTAAGAHLWQLPPDAEGRVDLEALLRRLVDAGCYHVLVEGGTGVFAAFLRQGLADELWLFLAPKLVGESGRAWSGPLGICRMSEALELGALELDRWGEDVRLRALLKSSVG